MFKNKIFIFSIIITILAVNLNFGLAQEKKATLVLSLTTALKMAEERHIDVIVADERVNQAIARIGEQTSFLLPQVTGNISDQRQTRDLRSVGTPAAEPLIGPFDSYDARIKLTQTIFDPAAMERLKAAQHNRELSTIELQKTKQDILALVATFFIEAKRAAENQQAAEVLLDRDKEKLKVAEAKYKNGTGSLLELEKAKADRARSFRVWRDAAADSLKRRLDLTAALGLSSDQPIRFSEEINLSDAVLPTKEEALKNLDEHPDIRSARQRVDTEKSNLAVERSEFLPKISALADYGRAGENPDHSSSTYSVGLQASVPLFEGGLRRSRIKEAASRMKENEEILKDTRRHVDARILNAIESIKKAKAFLKQKNTEQDLADQNFNLAERRFDSGTGSKLELAEASAQKALSEDELKEAQAVYLLARINLAHALGKIDQLFIEGEQREK